MTFFYLKFFFEFILNFHFIFSKKMPKYTKAQRAYLEPNRMELYYYTYLWKRRDR